MPILKDISFLLTSVYQQGNVQKSLKICQITKFDISFQKKKKKTLEAKIRTLPLSQTMLPKDFAF
jgi:hypothetical protein